ncbi:2316_t:CDS:2 [Ambispora leptoticha]|uniref:2316_t:CDS:1 n=1 Tax=Ambispora leptoticha TaxID=144679 RepID=A0A9N9GH32_9GLOM|nr:2316_t:CDS:2 [Ambispora leptoticha]
MAPGMFVFHLAWKWHQECDLKRELTKRQVRIPLGLGTENGTGNVIRNENGAGNGDSECELDKFIFRLAWKQKMALGIFHILLDLSTENGAGNGDSEPLSNWY